MGVIEIEGMEFYAFHGHYAEEQIVGNKFLIDLRLEADCSAAAKSDNIHDALNYQTAYKVVAAQMQTKSYLLEHLAQRILDALFHKLTHLKYASVKVSKLNPPMGGKIEKVSVTLSGEA